MLFEGAVYTEYGLSRGCGTQWWSLLKPQSFGWSYWGRAGSTPAEKRLWATISACKKRTSQKTSRIEASVEHEFHIPSREWRNSGRFRTASRRATCVWNDTWRLSWLLTDIEQSNLLVTVKISHHPEFHIAFGLAAKKLTRISAFYFDKLKKIFFFKLQQCETGLLSLNAEYTYTQNNKTPHKETNKQIKTPEPYAYSAYCCLFQSMSTS